MIEPGTHEVCVMGPNLNDESKGEFHAHADDCADLLRNYGPGTIWGGTAREPDHYFSVSSKLELIEILYGDILEETGDRPEQYIQHIHWAPCLNDLPLGVTVGGCGDIRGVFPSQARAAAHLKGAAE